MLKKGKIKKTVDFKLAAGVLLLLVVVLLVAWIFRSASTPKQYSIYLRDYEEESHGWIYHVLDETGSREYNPVWKDEITLDYGVEKPRAVSITRTMAEKMEAAELVLELGSGTGAEVLLNQEILYSDYAGGERVENGFLPYNAIQDRQNFAFRTVRLLLPEDYVGKELTVYTYFGEQEGLFNPVYPYIGNDISFNAFQVTGSMIPAMVLAFLGMIAVMLMMIYVIGLYHHTADHKILLLVAFCIFLLLKRAGESMSYSSFPDGWLFTISGRLYLVPLLLFMVDDIYSRRKHFFRNKAARSRFFTWKTGALLIWVSIACVCYYAADFDSVLLYLKNIIISMEMKNYRPAVKLLSSVYAIMAVVLIAADFFRRNVQQQVQISVLEVREKNALENYRIMQQADEETKKMRHEMRHHLSALYGIIQEQQFDKAKEYLHTLVEQTEQLPISRYSENLVVNAIAGSYLNRAKAEGIAVKSEIRLREKVGVKEEDLCVLLGNMLENALEACEKMEDPSAGYIHIEINTDDRFFYAECKNSSPKWTDTYREGR